MRSFVKYFNCGNIYKSRESFVYRVEKFSDIENKIIPFFNKYKIQGVKYLDYIDFCKTAELLKNKTHITKKGLEQIRAIKIGMNKGRI
jgi:LAGLIDADG endonuclease